MEATYTIVAGHATSPLTRSPAETTPARDATAVARAGCSRSEPVLILPPSETKRPAVAPAFDLTRSSTPAAPRRDTVIRALVALCPTKTRGGVLKLSARLAARSRTTRRSATPTLPRSTATPGAVRRAGCLVARRRAPLARHDADPVSALRLVGALVRSPPTASRRAHRCQAQPSPSVGGCRHSSRRGHAASCSTCARNHAALGPVRGRTPSARRDRRRRRYRAGTEPFNKRRATWCGGSYERRASRTPTRSARERVNRAGAHRGGRADLVV